MKAKEYSKQFIEKFQNRTFDKYPEDEVNAELLSLSKSFLADFETIREQRNINRGSKEQSLVNLINEFNKKWKIICLNINNYLEYVFEVTALRYNGFLLLLKKLDPIYTDIIFRYKIV